MCPELGDTRSSPPALGDCGHFSIESYKHVMKVLHLIARRVKNSNAYLHANHMCFLLLALFEDARLEAAGAPHVQPARLCQPRRAEMLQAFAFLLKPRKKTKHKPLDFCFYQKLRFNLVFTGPLLLFPGRRENGTPGPGVPLPAALPAHPGQGWNPSGATSRVPEATEALWDYGD